MAHARVPACFVVCRALKVLTSALLLPAAAWGQESAVEMEPIVVTLSVVPLALSEVPGSVTVLNRAEIDASAAATLADVLRSTPFVDLSRVGGRGGLASVTIRGGDPNFTLVLLDGIPVNDPTNVLGGSFDFSTLPTDAIERVEIVRGALSSRFGSEAMAGVVNVITRRGSDGPTWSAEGALGSFETRQLEITGRAAGSHADVAASFSVLDTGEQVEADPFRLVTFTGVGGVDVGRGVVRLVARMNDAEAAGFPENGGGPRFSLLREPESSQSRELLAGLGFRYPMGQQIMVEVTADLYDRRSDNSAPPILDSMPPGPRALPAFDADIRFERKRVGITTTWESTAGVALVAGLEARREEGRTDALIDGTLPAQFDLDRTTRSALGEILYRTRRLVVDLGFRLDDPDGFGSELSPRAALVYRPMEFTRFAVSAGDGFKLPSFFALGEPNVGNPDLSPEHGRGFDVAISHHLPSLGMTLTTTYFRQRYRDLIDFSPEEFRLVNRRSARTRGVEVEARLNPTGRFSADVHVRWLDAELEGTDEVLRDRPRWRGALTARWDTALTHTQLETVWVGDRFDFQVPVPERRTAGGYALSAVAVSWRIVDGLTGFARVDNIFDRDYEEFIGFPGLGRHLRAGVRVEAERR